MNTKRKIGIGAICVGIGLFGLTLDIDKVGHYFGNGALFGIGVSLIGSEVAKIGKKKIK